MSPSVCHKHRRNFVCDDGVLSPPLLKVVVTVTTTFTKWNLQFFKQFPIPHPTRRLRRLDRRAPDTKSWRRHWSPRLFKVKLRQWSQVGVESKRLDGSSCFWRMEISFDLSYSAVKEIRVNVANCHAKVQKLLVRQVLNKLKL